MNTGTRSVDLNLESDKFAQIFATLPPLDSAEYLELLRIKPTNELPAQVLARSFRQLISSGSLQAANATLERLLGSSKFDYLKAVRVMARDWVIQGQYVYDETDLIQATRVEIAKTLPTTRGELAERSWLLFSKHRFLDAWRTINGRKAGRFRTERVEPKYNGENGETFDPLDEADMAAAPWHVKLVESQLPWLEDFIKRTVAKISDPVIQYVARDQFSCDPSPISAGISADGKCPLTEQLGLNRFRISRALRSAKARLAAELLSQREVDLDAAWLRECLTSLGRPAAIVQKSQRIEGAVSNRRKSASEFLQ